MSYLGNRYNRFINTLKNQNIIGVKEVHHIIPKSLGGTNDSSNLIALTPRQHYIAHWMLWKIHGNKMAQAFWFMNNNGNHKKIFSKGYEKLRIEAIASFSGSNAYWYGKQHSEETRAKQSEKRKLYMSDPKARENIKNHRANQIIPKESYIKQAKTLSSLVWMNDGNRSYRIKPELVDDKLNQGLLCGRLMTHITEEYKQNRSKIASAQWEKIKLTGHTGDLKGYNK